MTDNIKLFNSLTEYLDTHKRTYVTDNFAYSSYNPPNTMFELSNDLPDIMSTLDSPSLKMYLKCLKLLRRNHDPVMAIIVKMTPEDFSDVCSRSTYFKAKKTLIDLDLLAKTPKPSIMIVNPKYAHKLFKPKLDLPNDL